MADTNLWLVLEKPLSLGADSSFLVSGVECPHCLLPQLKERRGEKKKSNPRKTPNLELLKNLDDQKLTSGPDGALVSST